MRLFKYELQKLFCRKIVVLVCLCAVIANLFTFHMLEKNKARYVYRGEDYKNFEQDYLKTQKTKELSKSIKHLEALCKLYVLEDGLQENRFGQEEYEAFAQEIMEQYGNGILEELKEFKKEISYSTACAYSFYINDLKRQLQYIREYQEFRNGMEKRAEEFSKVSVFAEKGSFSNRNLQKTNRDFAQLGTIEISTGNQYGVNAFLDYHYSGVYLLFSVLILCMGLWQKENERGLIPLIKSQKKGKLQLLAAKIGALFFCTTMMGLFCQFSIYAASASMYGMGDLSISIQSLEKYRNCCMNLNMGQFILLSIVTQVVTACVAGLLLFLCFLLLQKNTYVFTVCGSMMLFFCGCYFFIPGTSSFSFFKYINPVSGMLPVKLYGSYRNMNLCGYAVSIFPVFIVFLVVLLLAGIAVAALIWCRGKGMKKWNVSFFPASGKIRGKTGILSMQLYECFFREKKIVFCVLLLLYGVNTAFFTSTAYKTQIETEKDYKRYVKELEGTVTEKTEAAVREKENFYEEVWKQLGELGAKESTNAEDYAKLTALSSLTGVPYSAFEEVKEQYEYLKERKEQGKQAVFLDKYSWNRQFGNTVREVNSVMSSGIMTVLLCGTLFSDSRKMKALTASMKKGRRSLWRRQYIIGIGCAVLSWACMVLPVLIQFFREKPLSLFGAYMGNLPLFSQVKEELSLGWVMGLMYAGSLLVCILTSCITMLLVDITENSFAIMTAVTVCFLVAGTALNRSRCGIFTSIIMKSSYPVRNLTVVCLVFIVLIAIPILLWEKEVLYPKKSLFRHA